MSSRPRPARASRRWCGSSRRYHVPTPTLSAIGRTLARWKMPTCAPMVCNHDLTCRECGTRLASCTPRMCPSAETSAHLWLDRA